MMNNYFKLLGEVIVYEPLRIFQMCQLLSPYNDNHLVWANQIWSAHHSSCVCELMGLNGVQR